MEITVVNSQKKIPINPTKIKQIIRKVLHHKSVSKGSLSVVFVTDRKIRSLHKKYLQRDRATDVITFDLREGSKSKKMMDGEIIISTTTAFRQSKEYETAPFNEVVLYIIHGILHLLGYDDHTAKDIKVMRQQEEKLMKLVGLQ